MLIEKQPPDIHPIIKKCLTHLDVLGADAKLKQIVYMYMETLHKEIGSSKSDIIEWKYSNLKTTVYQLFFIFLCIICKNG